MDYNNDLDMVIMNKAMKDSFKMKAEDPLYKTPDAIVKYLGYDPAELYRRLNGTYNAGPTYKITNSA
jgi:hypothetical protein